MMTTGLTTPSEAVPAQTVPVGSIVLIGLGVVPYAMVMAGMSDLHDVDGISRGLAGVYAVIGIAILWIMLAILLGLGAAKGRMPSWAGIAALVLHPVSLVAVGATVDLLSSPGFDWALIVPGVLPPLIAAYALWARLPGLHGVLPGDRDERRRLRCGATVIGCAMDCAIATLVRAGRGACAATAASGHLGRRTPGTGDA